MVRSPDLVPLLPSLTADVKAFFFGEKSLSQIPRVGQLLSLVIATIGA